MKERKKGRKGGIRTVVMMGSKMEGWKGRKRKGRKEGKGQEERKGRKGREGRKGRRGEREGEGEGE